MAERVVDRLQAVEVDEQHRCLRVVAADARDQPLELAKEAAAIRKVDQAVLVREMVELLDALLKLRNLAAQPTDLLDQPLRRPRRQSHGQTLPRAPPFCDHMP